MQAVAKIVRNNNINFITILMDSNARFCVLICNLFEKILLANILPPRAEDLRIFIEINRFAYGGCKEFVVSTF